jgi:hypothetical protein
MDAKTAKDAIRQKAKPHLDRFMKAAAEAAPGFARDIEDVLQAFPYPDLSNEERARYLLVRELEKRVLDIRLNQDGNRDRIKREARGNPCPMCGEEMKAEEKIELDHEMYDGRPPRAVHEKCHKERQPH